MQYRVKGVVADLMGAGFGWGQGLWSGAKVVRGGVELRLEEECNSPVSSCPRSGPGIASNIIIQAKHRLPRSTLPHG